MTFLGATIVKRLIWILTLCFSILPFTTANAVLIDFEGFAPAGSSINIPTVSPYMEDGFTITPTNNLSAVFDSAAPFTMFGNNTDWFGFNESNIPSLTLTAGGMSFNLIDVLIGPSNAASVIPINMTIVGNFFGGGTVSSTFTNLNTATLATLNWSNLASVDFRTTDDAGLDNIRVAVPEPTTLVLLSLGLVGLGFTQRRMKA